MQNKAGSRFSRVDPSEEAGTPMLEWGFSSTAPWNDVFGDGHTVIRSYGGGQVTVRKAGSYLLNKDFCLPGP